MSSQGIEPALAPASGGTLGFRTHRCWRSFSSAVCLHDPNPAGPPQLLALDQSFDGHRGLTLAHILPALAFALLAPFFLLRREAVWMRPVLLAIGTVVGITAYAMSSFAVGGRLEQAAVLLFNTLFLYWLWRAYLQARRRQDLDARRSWIRSVAILFGIATTRPVMGFFFATAALPGFSRSSSSGLPFGSVSQSIRWPWSGGSARQPSSPRRLSCIEYTSILTRHACDRSVWLACLYQPAYLTHVSDRPEKRNSSARFRILRVWALQTRKSPVKNKPRARISMSRRTTAAIITCSACGGPIRPHGRRSRGFGPTGRPASRCASATRPGWMSSWNWGSLRSRWM